jgi:hypothetical protein
MKASESKTRQEDALMDFCLMFFPEELVFAASSCCSIWSLFSLEFLIFIPSPKEGNFMQKYGEGVY